MRDFMTFLMILVPVIILLVLNFIIAREFRRIAEDKGHDGRRYFHFCFWLGLVGMLMVIALPDRAGQAAAYSSSAGNHPVAQPPQKPTQKPRRSAAPAAAAPWRCSCGAVNSASRSICDSCGTNKLDRSGALTGVSSSAPVNTPAPAQWDCVCGQSNTRSSHCRKCGAWLCSCGSINPAARGACESCGAAKPPLTR